MFVSPVFGQQTEEDIMKEANKLFEQEEYVQATPLYLRLLSLNPKVADYNFKYGTCLLFNSNQKSEGLRYLKFAVKDISVDPRAFYFHGKALHLDYQFDKAISSYERYAKLVGSKVDNRYDVNRQISMCQNGKKLLTTFTDIIVAEKKEIDELKFFRIYTDVETIGGEILVAEQFQSKFDRKMGHVPVVHFPPAADAVYYSSYGDNDDNGLDIFIRRRLPDGSFGKPQRLPGYVNTPEDENFPYMHPSGRFLYFSSRGHNSMGGYDVFMSRFRESKNDFAPPENVDFAISSPDDDLFYVVDSLFQNAYFASARQSENGKLHVYRVKVARIPIQEVIVMGDFESTVSPESAQMFITLRNHTNNKKVAETESNEDNKYAIVFPKGGKYEYDITVTTNADEYKYLVEIPFLEDFKPLKQKILHTTNEDGDEIIKIFNLFDEDVEGAEEIIAQVIRNKSKLDVNIDQFDMEKFEQEAKTKEILADLNMNNMTPAEIAIKLNELDGQKESNRKQGEKINNNIDNTIINNASRIATLGEEQAAIMEQVNNSTDPIVQHKLLIAAKEKEWEKMTLADEVKTLTALKEEIFQKMGINDESANLDEVITNYSALLDEGKEFEAMKYLGEHSAEINKIQNGSSDVILKKLVEERIQVKAEFDKAKSQEAEMTKRIKDLQTNINVAESKLLSAKKKEAARLRADIEDMKRDISRTEKERVYVVQNKKELSKKLNQLDSRISSIQEAASNETIVVIAEEKVRQAIEDVSSVPTDEEGTPYDEQILALEKENPELATDGQAGTTDQGQSISEIRRAHSGDEQEIRGDDNLSEEEQLEKLIDNVKETIADLEAQEEKLNAKLELNPNNSDAQEELEELQRYKETLEEKEIEYRNELQELESVVETKDYTEEIKELTEELIPDYEASVNATETLPEREKYEELIDIDKNAITELEEKEREVKDQLANDSQNVLLQEELSIVQAAIEEKEENINANRSELEAMEIGVAAISQEEIINELSSNYLQELEDIKNNPEFSALEKQIQSKELREELFKEAQKEVEATQKKIDRDPNDEELVTKKEALTVLMSNLSEEIAENEQTINAMQGATSVVDMATLKDEYIESVYPNYEEEKMDIENNGESRPAQIEELLRVENKLVEELQEELVKLNKQIKKNPSDEALLQKKMALESLIKNKEEIITELENEKSSFSSTGVSLAEAKSELLNEVAPNYITEKKRLEGETVSEEVKYENLIALEEALLDNLRTKRKELEKALKKEPANKTIQSQLEAVNELIQETEARIATFKENKEVIEESNKVLASSEALINEIDPEYLERVDVVNGDPTTNQEQKLLALIAENNGLMEAIQNEIKEVEESLINTPDDNKLLERKEQLEELYEAISNKTKVLENELQELSGNSIVASEEEIKTIIIADVDPEYNAKVAKIEDYGLSKEEEIELRIELETDLISELTAYKEQLENYIAENPFDEETERKKEILESLIAEKEEEVKSLRAELIEEQNKQRVFSENEQVLAAMAPDYIQEREDIENSDELTELEKLEALQALDKEVLEVIQEERELVAQRRLLNPGDSELEKRENELIELAEVIQAQIDSQAARIEELENQTETQPTIVRVDKDEVLNEVLGSYEGEKNEIESGNLSPTDRAVATYKLEKELEEKLAKEKEELENKISKNPNDEESKARLVAVKQLISENKSRLETLKTKLEIIDENSEAYIEALSEVDNTYTEDIENIKQEGGATLNSNIAEREEILQENIKERIEELEEKQKRRFSVDVDLELMTLNGMLQASEKREEEARNAGNDVVSEEQENFINELREDLLEGNENLVEQEFNTIEELETQDAALAEYEEEIQNRIETVEESLENYPSNEELQNELEWLEEEQKEVQKKRRQIKISVGDLETEVISEVKSSPSDDPQIRELEEEEQELLVILNDGSASKEDIAAATERMEEVNEEKTVRENEIIKENLEVSEKENEDLTAELESLATDENSTSIERVKEINESESKAIDEMKAEASSASSEEERKFILNEAEQRQEDLNEEVKEAIVEQTVHQLEEENGVTLNTKEDLEKKRRRFIIDIGDLGTEILRVDNEISTAKKRDVPELEEEKAALENRKESLEERLSAVDEELTQFTENPPVVSIKAMEQEITFNEERELAATEEYAAYEEKASQALQLEEQLTTLESEILTQREELGELLQEPGMTSDSPLVIKKVEEIKSTQEKIDRVNVELVQSRYEAKEALPANEEEAMKMENLALRRVAPIKTTVMALAIMNMPVEGLAIDESKESVYTEANPIPLEVKAPKGLIYRVQIGAFRNKIPQDLFSEFNPVSGEQIGNTGITRYMAGFFANSDVVVKAKNDIRQLGYSDAYVVAYCDGERIGFGEARRLEESGECIPQGADKLMMEVAVNTAESKGIDVGSEIKEVPEYTYAQAPGAVEADPIELTTGLFFTVQVGVFSKPVKRSDILDLDEIFTIRLPNGSIRYSSGMFNSVEEARERRAIAKSRGLKAFVTAYFEGERIPISEAEKLLEQRGNSILQTSIIANGEAIEYIAPDNPVRTDTVKSIGNLPIDNELPGERIQIVTKKSFSEFPRDILNRYNARGTFYYDKEDGKVKSVVTTNRARLPRVYKFKDDIDTVYLSNEFTDSIPTKIIRITMDVPLPGDFVDWLLRFSYRREFERKGDNQVLKLFGIEEDRVEGISEEIRNFGLSPEVLDKTEEELILEENE